MIAQESSAQTTPMGGLLHHRGFSLACMFVLIAGLVIGAPLVVADEDDDFPTNLEGIAPLRSLLAHVHESYPGHVLEVELERDEYGKRDVWVYEVKLLTERGNVLKLEYDAITLELLKMKGRL